MKNFKIFWFSVLLLFPALLFAQKTITGTVTEASSGSPLPGVGVIIKGTTLGTATDFDGNYTLANVNEGDVLVFSYIGFTTQEVTVGAQSTINVALSESAEALEEVVVIGYGTTTVKDATGSVASVTNEDFNEGNIVSPASLITGRVAGVNINTSGAPGGGSEIRIRGGSSLSASNDPLIVIDGLPISNASPSGSRSILNAINPNDIESFSILKDASSTAIYGSRASNGVIIITTKKGRQTFSVNYNIKTGYQTLADKIDVFSADEYRALIAERVALGQGGISVDQLGNSNTNWQDEIYDEKLTVDQSFSMSGALAENFPARISFGHTSNPGLRLTTKFERISSTLSLNPTFFDDHLKVNVNANLSAERNRFSDGVEGTALYFDPTQPVRDFRSPFGGFFEYYDANYARANAPRNPVASLLQRKNVSKVERFYGNAEFDYSFHDFEDLRLVVNIGYDRSYGEGSNTLDDKSINGVNLGAGYPYLGSRTEYTGERVNSLLDGYFVYNHEFGQVDVEATAGYSYQKFQGQDFNSGELRDPAREWDTNTWPDVVLIGLFARTNLSFFDKYLLTLSYRRDGTSRFSKDNRWGDFPAAALAWKISDEAFLSDSNLVSTLKLRLGWGVTGQQDIPQAYAYLGTYNIGNAYSQYVFGANSYPIANSSAIFEDLKWEETTTYNIGFDYGFFNDRISGSIDVYRKESEDLLADVAVPDGSNFTNVGPQNIGIFTSEGLEFSIGSDIIQKDDFNWNISYNFNYNETKIDQLARGLDLEVGGIAGGTGSRIHLHREGYSPNSFFVFKQLYDSAGNPIEGAYADINNDGIVNPSDRYIYKKPKSDVDMGFQSNIEYKKFDLSFNLRASLGNYVYNNVNSNGAQYNLLQAVTALGNLPTSVLDTNFNETSEVLLSDYYIENASFLKMDNLTLGYNFGNVGSDISSLRLWCGVQNVFTITNYSGLDPEVRNGVDNTIYPRARTFLLGANVKF
jgi:iron complex outermembrane receptor protein